MCEHKVKIRSKNRGGGLGFRIRKPYLNPNKFDKTTIWFKPYPNPNKFDKTTIWFKVICTNQHTSNDNYILH